MIVVQALIFLFSFFGLCAFLARFIRTRLEFIPLLTISLISILIFLSGIFHFLYWMSIAMYVFGLLYAIYFFLRWKQRRISLHVLIIIIIVCMLLVYLFIGTLMHYDNFSHWALMVKEMLALNVYPTSYNDNIISFITYPPGSANVIYYICRFISVKEGAMIFAQALITFFSVAPLLALIKKRRIISYIAFLAAVIIAFTLNVVVHDLLVDSILATIGASLTIIIYTYRTRLKESLIIIVPIIIFVCLIKNSGVFFVIGNIALYLYFYIRCKTFNVRDILLMVGCFALPFVMSALWKWHVDMSFTPEMIQGAKHTMSITSYLKNVDLLDMEAIKAISNNYFRALFSSQYLIMVILYIIDGIAIIMCIFFKKEYRKAIVAMHVFGIIYLISLWAMYLFSMPYNEAIDLASFERYLATFVLYYILILIMLFYISDGTRPITLCVSAVVLITLCVGCDVPSLLYPTYQHVRLKDSDRARVTRALEMFLQDEQVADGKSLVVYVADVAYTEDYYTYYTRYILGRNDVQVITDEGSLPTTDDYYIIR